jgi:hypothetical protein
VAPPSVSKTKSTYGAKAMSPNNGLPLSS